MSMAPVDTIEEDAADLQFPKGKLTIIRKNSLISCRPLVLASPTSPPEKYHTQWHVILVENVKP